MIKGGSLFYAIVISLLIAIISSAFILFAYFSHSQFQNWEINDRLNLNANSGITFLLSDQSVVPLNSKVSLDLYNDGFDSVELIYRSWGATEIAISKALFKDRKVTRSAQVGIALDTNDLYSLYLADEDKPLSVCGTTKIVGDAYLPKTGVKRGYIEGQSYTGTSFVEGKIKLSSNSIPGLGDNVLSTINTLSSGKPLMNDDSIIDIASDKMTDTLKQSFGSKSIFFTSQKKIILAGASYSGNIVIRSAKQITVTAETFLQDVILCAPMVILEKGFRGNLQVFASDSIIVSENVTLNYPSILGIVTNKNSLSTACILTNENDTISGSLFAFKNNAGQIQAGIVLKKKAILNGQVYSNGYVDLQGTVNGNVMSEKIILSTPSSVYENHLLNARIDITRLSKFFAGINTGGKTSTKTVMKWVY